ncbi:MAG: GNAT family N-acetyltransferase [Achromobacter sp.]|uniref:GNAT family N-acetyltransferase n=1 Tax=unclassified Achromobacter TaxID=2626865 RepID=UPI0006F69159|nr:GNAT family N-acetyltransferase [Achromobacter sp. Root565]KRA01698.1 GCN5 family acetyltransferase [Achromobacter sp. Root565]
MHTSSTEPALRHLETPEEWRACLPLMRELRPHLAHADDFTERLARMHQENYRLLAVMRDGQAVALAGYRYQENLIYGRFMYVDDLVVDPSARGSRWGARLIAELDQLARGADCDKLVLDTGLGNALAQRFYFRQGLLTSAIRFSKPLKGSSQ